MLKGWDLQALGSGLMVWDFGFHDVNWFESFTTVPVYVLKD